MGSMRNPVGPLPSSIYWRRRVIAVCLLALVVAITVWGLNSGGGGGSKGSGAPSGPHTPVATITAGPAPTGTHISGRPGGRDTPPGDGTGNGGTSGGGSGDTGGTAGSAGSSGAATGGGSGGGTTAGTTAGTTTGVTAGTAGGSTAGGGTGGASGVDNRLAANSTLPDCRPGSVRIALASAQNSYSPGQTPAFRLTAVNSDSVTCKMDFAPAKAVFTITKAADNSHVWASDDCPASGSYLLQVPAHSSTTYTLRWDGKTSSPKCAQPKGQTAGPGTYLVQAAVAGYGSKQVSFVLAAD